MVGRWRIGEPGRGCRGERLGLLLLVGRFAVGGWGLSCFGLDFGFEGRRFEGIFGRLLEG